MVNCKTLGKNCGLIKVPCWHVRRETHGILGQNIPGAGQHLNQALPKYRSTVLPIDLPVQYHELTAKNQQHSYALRQNGAWILKCYHFGELLQIDCDKYISFLTNKGRTITHSHTMCWAPNLRSSCSSSYNARYLYLLVLSPPLYSCSNEFPGHERQS